MEKISKNAENGIAINDKKALHCIALSKKLKESIL